VSILKLQYNLLLVTGQVMRLCHDTCKEMQFLEPQFCLNGGKGKKEVGKWFPSSVLLLTERSSRLFTSSKVLLSCAIKHMKMLSVEAERDKTKAGPQIEEATQRSGEA